MLERFPGLNLNDINRMTFPLRKYHTLLCARTRVYASFLVRWGLRSVVMVGVWPFNLLPRTLLAIFCVDPRGVQHARGGLGDAFGADARTVVIAGWGEICASSQMREQPRVEHLGLTFPFSVARVRIVLHAYEASFDPKYKAQG
jgi:hypothetical protein